MHLPPHLIRAAAEQRGTSLEVDEIEIAFASCPDGSLSCELAPTDSLADLLISGECQSVPWPFSLRGHCHFGYAVHGIGLLLDDRLLERIHGRTVRVRGHSLGGPVGMAFALTLHELGWQVLSVETYGAPRWLKPGFRWPTEIPRTRYVCGIDPVPVLWPGYRHGVDATKLPSQYCTLNPFRVFFDHQLRSYERAFDHGEIGRNNNSR